MLRVRTAGLDDARILAELNQDVQQLHVEALPDIYKPVSDLKPIEDDFRTRILSDSDWRTWIAEVDNMPAGYICARLMERPEHCYAYAQTYLLIDQISVRPRYQRHGCGRLLMQTALDWGQTQGVRRVALDVLAFNADALDFYAALGFSAYKYTLELNLEDERQLNTL